jgi:hypothetical protein
LGIGSHQFDNRPTRGEFVRPALRIVNALVRVDPQAVIDRR